MSPATGMEVSLSEIRALYRGELTTPTPDIKNTVRLGELLEANSAALGPKFRWFVERIPMELRQAEAFIAFFEHEDAAQSARESQQIKSGRW
jgi:hypothetical protein